MGKKKSTFLKNILGHPTLAVVIEDNIWEYGKLKEKSKVNIPVLLPLQEPSEYLTEFTEEKNDKIIDKELEMTRNYLEIYLPDSVYTFPTEDMVENMHQTLFGATHDHPWDNGENGAEVEGMIRVVPAGTKLMVLIADGNAIEDNIKVLFKWDDFEEDLEVHHGVTEHTRQAALR